LDCIFLLASSKFVQTSDVGPPGYRLVCRVSSTYPERTTYVH